MKKFWSIFFLLIVSRHAFGQAVTGTSLSITNTSSGNRVATETTSGGVTTNNSISTGTGGVYLNGNTQSSGTYTSSTWINIETSGSSAGINSGSSNKINFYSGNLTGVGGNINGTSSLEITPTMATLTTRGSGSTTGIGWGPTSDSTNYVTTDVSGINIVSATAISLQGTSNTITGTTNLNTTGNSNSNIGGNGTGVVTLQSGTNSYVLNNSGSTITGSLTISGVSNLNGITNNIGTTQASTNNIGTFSGSVNNIGSANSTNVILGATSINTTGSANTSIGNSTGTITVNGSSVNLATNSGSTINVGNSSGNSTINMNGNKIQNVANGTSANDAVNYSQLSSVSSNVSSLSNSINNLSNQIQQNQSEYRNGIAGVAAMNAIGGLGAGQKVNLGIGVGSFGGQSGVAVGGNLRLFDNVSLKASVATASNNTSSSVGLTIGF